jgi:hypothetical protein
VGQEFLGVSLMIYLLLPRISQRSNAARTHPTPQMRARPTNARPRPTHPANARPAPTPTPSSLFPPCTCRVSGAHLHHLPLSPRRPLGHALGRWPRPWPDLGPIGLRLRALIHPPHRRRTGSSDPAGGWPFPPVPEWFFRFTFSSNKSWRAVVRKAKKGDALKPASTCKFQSAPRGADSDADVRGRPRAGDATVRADFGVWV